MLAVDGVKNIQSVHGDHIHMLFCCWNDSLAECISIMPILFTKEAFKRNSDESVPFK